MYARTTTISKGVDDFTLSRMLKMAADVMYSDFRREFPNATVTAVNNPLIADFTIDFYGKPVPFQKIGMSLEFTDETTA
jgi:hypothetical protein